MLIIIRAYSMKPLTTFDFSFYMPQFSKVRIKLYAPIPLRVSSVNGKLSHAKCFER